jgi:hypothetical protein
VRLDRNEGERESDGKATAGQEQEGWQHCVRCRLRRDEVAGTGDQRQTEWACEKRPLAISQRTDSGEVNM